MDRALIVSLNEQSIVSVSKLLIHEGFSETESVNTAGECMRMIGDRVYDVVIIDSPLSDRSAEQLAVDVVRKTESGVILLIRSDLEAEVEKHTMKHGVFVLGKPLSRQLFFKALHLTEAMRNRLSGALEENDRLKKRIDDSKVIDRAKAILMEYLSMSEAQAHKYLERQAMDLRITKVEVAKRLLSTYEN